MRGLHVSRDDNVLSTVLGWCMLVAEQAGQDVLIRGHLHAVKLVASARSPA